MSQSLQKGQEFFIGFTNLLVGLGWDPAETGTDFDLDASACLLNKQRIIPDENHVIYYNNPQSVDGSCYTTGDDRSGRNSIEGDDEQIIVDLASINPDIQTIVFCASIYEAAQRKQNFGQVKNAYIRICNADTNVEICRYQLDTQFSQETAIEFGFLQCSYNYWKFFPTGIGNPHGLEGIVAKYS